MPHPYWPEGSPRSRPDSTSATAAPSLGGSLTVEQAIQIARPGWHDYFLGIARAAAARSDCIRSKVGAVLVRERRVRSTGYNGAPAGMAGCGTCPRAGSAVTPLSGGYDTPGAPGACVAVHAEVNAVLYAERSDVVGSTVYVTREPCAACTKTCRAAGVHFIVWPGDPATAMGINPIVIQDLRKSC